MKPGHFFSRTIFIMALLSGVFGCAFLFAGEIMKASDETQDGFEETKTYYIDQVIERVEVDKNKDGSSDRITLYLNGVKKNRFIDIDYDGEWDSWDYYNSVGHRRRTAKDKNRDGKADYWIYYLKEGRGLLREYDMNYDGKVDRREVTNFMYHKATKTMRHLYAWKEVDENYDGIIDVYRVRGVKEPEDDRVGQPINIKFRTIQDELDEDQSRSDDEPISGAARVAQMASDRLKLAYDSQEALKK